jgi:uncharacterized protein YbjT (DUF2867 family)
VTTAFVAGATGYTGRNVVRALVARGVRTVAHVRPGAPSLEAWRGRFAGEGASVDVSPWTPEGMVGAMDRWRPNFVFALLGTTARRGKVDGGSYESVDYGLTVMLLDAASGLTPRPCFVYLSAVGAGRRTANPYLLARTRVEARVLALDGPHLIARPSFITGPDRPEPRLAERAAARVVDAVSGALATVGVSGPRERYGSMTGPELGEALVRLAIDRGVRGIVEAGLLRRVGPGEAAPLPPDDLE